MRLRHILVVAVAVVSLANAAVAQNRRAQTRAKAPPTAAAAAATAGKTLCVDVVSFRQGKPAKGLIIASQADQVLMAVEREVLSHDNPELYQRAATAERDQAERAWSQLRERLRQQLDLDRRDSPASSAEADETAQPNNAGQPNNAAQPNNAGAAPNAKQLSRGVRGLFESELARAEKQLETLAAHPGEPLSNRFVWLELSSREIQAVKHASPEAQRIAVWSWSEKLKDVSSRDAADLQRELADEKINAKLQPPDLSQELAPREQSDDEWAARLAIVDYALGKPLDFQGSNGVFVRTGEGAEAADLAPLIQKMMGGNLEALLAELDPTARKASGGAPANDWFKSIIPRAEELQRGEFRATRVDPDPSGQVATVETAFVARLPSKGWHVVWSGKHTTQSSEVSPEAEQQIAGDPQVKTALSLLSALGAGAEAEIQKALRFGAATMSAQQAAQSQFFQFRDRYIQRLDGPPL